MNDISLGKHKLEKFKTEFKVPYRSGKLSAVVYDQAGEKNGETELISAKEDIGISIIPEESSIKAGDIAYINILLTDEYGIVESNADCKISVTVEGGDLLAFGSACPRTEESYNSGKFTTYYGRAQAIVRASNTNQMVIKAVSCELKKTSITVRVI